MRVAYETWGTLAADASNAVLIEHALTGDSHVVGPAGPGHPTPGWWDGLIGPGAPLDTDRFFVVCANVLGGCQGTTGPSSLAPDDGRWGSRFPEITVGDQVRVEAALADALGISRWACVVGGSMGGMRALEWAVAMPDRVATLFFLASGAVASADQIGTQTTQQAAVRADPRWAGGDYDPADPPVDGLGIARRIAHLTYRSAFELGERFGTVVQDDGRYAVASYLDHHADKLARRFDAGSYVLLTETMNSWDVGRGRGGVEAALHGRHGTGGRGRRGQRPAVPDRAAATGRRCPRGSAAGDRLAVRPRRLPHRGRRGRPPAARPARLTEPRPNRRDRRSRPVCEAWRARSPISPGSGGR